MITLEEIQKLSVAERIRLAEDIWDSIPPQSEELTLTPAQKAELERRIALHERDPQGLPWSEVRDSLRSKS